MDVAGRRARTVHVIWIEIVLGFAVPIAWGVWQLVDLKREKKKDAAKRSATGDLPDR